MASLATQPVRARIDAEVRYAETDAMGIVHHANYLVWFELARTSLCRQSGHHYADIEKLGHSLTVTGATLRYRKAARYGDTVHLVCWIARLASRGVRFGYEVRRGDDLLATGTTEHVWIDPSGAPCRMPDELRPGFERVAGIRPSEE